MTTRATGGAEGLDCVIVGGGLAGLACAHGLVTAGRSVHLLDAEEAPGGRARTVWHRGRPVDRGFQVVFSAYPRTRALMRAIGLPAARPAARQRRRRVRPRRRAPRASGRPRSRRCGFTRPARAPTGAGWRPLAAEVLARPADGLLAQDDDGPPPRGSCVRRASPTTRSRASSGPLFGVVLLDRSLGADRGYFRFLLVDARRAGPSAIPSDGLGMIAEWTSAAVRQAGGIDRPGRPRRGPRAGRRRTADRRRHAPTTAAASRRARWCWPSTPRRPPGCSAPLDPDVGGPAALRGGVVGDGGVRPARAALPGARDPR